MSEIKVTLAGNPNVGKSTVFNYLTGMNQHTGNWAGKTVGSAVGRCKHELGEIELTDIPGTYSLYSLSYDEEVARQHIESGEADCTVVVCDASSLERNLILALQIMSVTKGVVICCNLMDEAKRRGVIVDCEKLSQLLGVPVVAASALAGDGMDALCRAMFQASHTPSDMRPRADRQTIARKARDIARSVTVYSDDKKRERERKIDAVLMGKYTGIPAMLLLLSVVLWITVYGANMPSELLSAFLFRIGDGIRSFLVSVGAPWWLIGSLIDGAYMTSAWVVGVMLPPMAIFFPMFTLLEDLGYLPRVAFNLDHVFCRCGSCGKQALTM